MSERKPEWFEGLSESAPLPRIQKRNYPISSDLVAPGAKHSLFVRPTGLFKVERIRPGALTGEAFIILQLSLNKHETLDAAIPCGVIENITMQYMDAGKKGSMLRIDVQNVSNKPARLALIVTVAEEDDNAPPDEGEDEDDKGFVR